MKRTSRRRALDPRQLQLLADLDRSLVTVPGEPEQAPASHDLDQKVRRWLHEAIDRSPLSREQIGDTMTALCGREITKPMLDSWTGASRPNRFPLDLLPAFCLAAGNNHLFEKLGGTMGLRVTDTVEARLARIGQWALVAAYASEQQKALAATLPELPLFRGGK